VPLPPTVSTLTTAVIAAGDVSDFTPSVQIGMRQAVADEVGVPIAAVTLTVEAASVLLTFEVVLPADVDALAAQSALATQLGSPAAASAFLAVTVESIAETPTSNLSPSPPPPAPGSSPLPSSSDDSSGSTVGVIAGVVGGVGFVLLLVALRAFCKSRQSSDGTTKQLPEQRAGQPGRQQTPQFQERSKSKLDPSSTASAAVAAASSVSAAHTTPTPAAYEDPEGGAGSFMGEISRRFSGFVGEVFTPPVHSPQDQVGEQSTFHV
jgi:hypothetical protein